MAGENDLTTAIEMCIAYALLLGLGAYGIVKLIIECGGCCCCRKHHPQDNIGTQPNDARIHPVPTATNGLASTMLLTDIIIQPSSSISQAASSTINTIIPTSVTTIGFFTSGQQQLLPDTQAGEPIPSLPSSDDHQSNTNSPSSTSPSSSMRESEPTLNQPIYK